MFPIGTLSQRTGVQVETIRYYERTGILPRPDRMPNGRRVYGPPDVHRLLMVRHAREFGFDMKAVRTLLQLHERPEAPCAEASALAADLLVAVDRQIKRLTAVRDDLAYMGRTCLNRRAANCRVIEGLLPSSRS